jgi:hypothetical protein
MSTAITGCFLAVRRDSARGGAAALVAFGVAARTRR